ncbi:MAG: PEP/pyruvate-binding domain-containing protein [Nitrospirota bacterium]
MTNFINANKDICRLDYLVGTLATAYKGAITSLVVKDFCMSDSGIITTLTGTILSIPAGNYEASLNQGGAELSRVVLRSGYFEFTADSNRIARARDLQIDILQSGRHIGTFLLKKEKAGGLYISAAELSEDLAGINLTRLTLPLHNKVGLLQKAEDIVSQIHSTKKDWASFSEKLNELSIDVFWSEPAAFYGAFDILSHFMLFAAERTGIAETSKPLSNYFDLLDLPVTNASDTVQLRTIAEIWLKTLSRSSIDLFPEARHAVAALRGLRKRLPDINPREVVRSLITSLKAKNASPPFLNSRILTPLDGLTSREEGELLSRFGERGQRLMAQVLSDAERRLIQGEVERALDLLADINGDIFDDRKAVAALFEVAEKDLSNASADAFAEVIAAFLAAADRLSGRALESVRISMPRILDKLIALGRPDVCEALLRGLGDIASTLLQQILLDPRIARSVLHSGHSGLITRYRDHLKQIVIPTSRPQGISSDTWAENVDPQHLELLARFVDLLMEGDERLESVLVHVIVNVAVSGVLIPDDRLFQRRISAYLNSPAMSGRFLLNYLLLERLPVYFNEVGATSRIRDYSTEIDSWGNDPIIYFLRKQVHVNASSHNVRLLEQVMRSWVENDASVLREVVPTDIYAQADPRLMERYSTVINRFFRSSGVRDEGGLHLGKLLEIPDETIAGRLRETGGEDDEAREKVGLACKLYKEIVRKYSLLSRDVAIDDVHDRFLSTIVRLDRLKAVVRSSKRTEPQESLYFKRHIAFGIPSVLGTYHEPKFDALSEMMRIGEDVPVLLQALISEIEEKGKTGTQSELEQWLASPAAAWAVLKAYGMQNVLIDEFAEVLKRSRLHLTQIIDVLKMWQKELAWMVSVLSRTFHGPLMEIIKNYPRDDFPEHIRKLDADSPDFAGKAADVVMRNLLNSIPGLVESDRFLESLVSVLRSRIAAGADGEQEAAEPPQLHEFYDIQAISLQDAIALAPELGSKAKNLIYLKEQGIPIPAGVVLPARHTRDYLFYTDQPGYPAILREAVKAIEMKTNEEFGGTVRPLFISVRSGSYPSMPGILSSILYCGMNEQTLEAFIRNTGNPGLGWDSYRRFIEYYGTAIYGLDIEFFEEIVREHRSSVSLGAGQPFDASQLGSLVGLYKSRLSAMRLQVPSDVYEQLRQCVRAVYSSWYSDRARQFRSATGTSEEWGTSVTLMEMVSGNQEGSGASVFFTRDPSTLEPAVYGETREGASGDELVSGRKYSRPLSRVQSAAGQKSLEDEDPGLFQLHQSLAGSVEDAFGKLPQEVEVTYTRDATGRRILSVLQTRRMEPGKQFSRSFDEICGMESRVIGHGIGANGGALSGVASFSTSPGAVERLGRESGVPVILIRKTANTDDVSLMPVIRGIVTASGGVTSHAAVLAHKFGLTAVVACADMKVARDEQDQPYALIGTTRVQEGAAISIDGMTGLVFSGTCFQLRDGA